MLTKRYMVSAKNLPAILQKIRDGTAPDKFTVDHLKKIGFASSNDRAVIPLLKDLGFLSPEGVPTARYHAYRDPSRSKSILGDALREVYADIFHLTEKPTKANREQIEGLFKSAHNVGDRVAELQAATFLTLLDHADIAGGPPPKKEVTPEEKRETRPQQLMAPEVSMGAIGLRYNIEIHLPASKDIEVYNAIFRSLKENLL